MEQLVARLAHIQEVGGSSPPPANHNRTLYERGYMSYSYKAMKVKGRRIDQHRKVIEDFLGEKIPEGYVVHHKDGDKRNNSLSNLEVMTRTEHSRMHRPSGTLMSPETKDKLRAMQLAHWKDRPSPYDRPVVQLSLSGEIIARFRSARDAQRKTGHFNSHIISCCNGVRKTHHGFMWRYDEK